MVPGVFLKLCGFNPQILRLKAIVIHSNIVVPVYSDWRGEGGQISLKTNEKGEVEGVVLVVIVPSPS